MTPWTEQPPGVTGDVVTVVVPTHNRAQVLPAAVRSALAQTHREIEVLIIDDGSSDSTRELCRQLGESDARVNSRRREQTATAAARGAAACSEQTSPSVLRSGALPR